MPARFVKLIGAALLVGTMWLSPAYGQAGQTTQRRPVVEYIVLTITIVITLVFVCRSSRRST